jgi:hypothetical protein
LACVLALVGICACSMKQSLDQGALDDDSPAIDASADASPVDTPSTDGPEVDGPPPALGTKENPARTCAELRAAGLPSAVYWVRVTDTSSPFEVYCEQQLNGGGWAMLENSVRRDDGTTTAFWQFKYADRLNQLGTLAPDQNYYNGALYLIGTEYMDVFVDLQDKTAIAAVMTASGINSDTMRFTTPKRISGNVSVYNSQFATGWSAQDFDGDLYAPSNCAVDYIKVTQHYSTCWAYNLGADVDPPRLDGGVGPHVFNTVLTSLALALQPAGGKYSQVKRIARFTRWR